MPDRIVDAQRGGTRQGDAVLALGEHRAFVVFVEPHAPAVAEDAWSGAGSRPPPTLPTFDNMEVVQRAARLTVSARAVGCLLAGVVYLALASAPALVGGPPSLALRMLFFFGPVAVAVLAAILTTRDRYRLLVNIGLFGCALVVVMWVGSWSWDSADTGHGPDWFARSVFSLLALVGTATMIAALGLVVGGRNSAG